MGLAKRSSSASLEAWLQNAWSHRGWWAHATWPLSKVLWWAHCAFEHLACSTSRAFKTTPSSPTRLPVPLLVVGNVFVGGVGKTPIVISLVEHLKANGLQVGVIARGHGSDLKGVHVLNEQSVATQFGDEPVLIQHRTQVPVVVGVDRLRAAQVLLERFPQTEIIVSDDGLQRLKRWADWVVCVFDERGLGNGWTLPAGPLREPWPRKPAGEDQAWVMVSQDPSLDPAQRPHPKPVIALHGKRFVAERRLGLVARNASGQTLELKSLIEPSPRTHLARSPRQAALVAVAGIAKPGQFFDMLSDLGLSLTARLGASDHASAQELMALLHDELANTEKPLTVLCTEKDASKLWSVFPQAWSVALEVRLEPLFLKEFDLAWRHRISSKHGHQTH